MKLNEIKPNKANPRTIKDDKFYKLVKSLKEFPEMMTKRPIVVDTDGTILGGNMRYKALIEIYGKQGDIPNEWVTVAQGWTDEQKRQFIIKDNASFGDWDFEELKLDWDVAELENWGIDVPSDKEKGGEVEGEVEFTEVLGEEHNYIVLYFDNEVDWLQAETLFDLKQVKNYSTRTDGKITEASERRGVGRVLRGADALNKILKR